MNNSGTVVRRTSQWGTVPEQTPGDSWIKRIRWSQSGYQPEDERVNAIASLWIEGTLTSVEIPAELREGLQYGQRYTGAKPTAPDLNFPDYVKAASVGSQWLALISAMDFANQQGWRTPESRRQALDMVSAALAEKDADKRPTQGAMSKRWWQDVRNASTTASWVDERVDAASSRWLTGASNTRQLVNELLAIQDDLQERKATDAKGTPEDQLPLWVQYVRLSCKAMILRTVADYCDAQGWQNESEKRQAVEQMDRALAGQSPPDVGRAR